jgi:hypothetical protein
MPSRTSKQRYGIFKEGGCLSGATQGQFMKAIWRTGGFWFGLLGEGWFELMRYCPTGWVLQEREKTGANGLLSRR